MSIGPYWSVLVYVGIKNNKTSNVFALGTKISYQNGANNITPYLIKAAGGILEFKVSIRFYWNILFDAGVKNNVTSNVFLGTEISYLGQKYSSISH